jgi:hypothetical protein
MHHNILQLDVHERHIKARHLLFSRSLWDTPCLLMNVN